MSSDGLRLPDRVWDRCPLGEAGLEVETIERSHRVSGSRYSRSRRMARRRSIKLIRRTCRSERRRRSQASSRPHWDRPADSCTMRARSVQNRLGCENGCDDCNRTRRPPLKCGRLIFAFSHYGWLPSSYGAIAKPSRAGRSLEALAPAPSPMREQDPKQPIRRTEARVTSLAALQQRDLMAKRDRGAGPY